jgi:hypothetical protein
MANAVMNLLATPRIAMRPGAALFCAIRIATVRSTTDSFSVAHDRCPVPRTGHEEHFRRQEVLNIGVTLEKDKPNSMARPLSSTLERTIAISTGGRISCGMIP